MRRTLVVALASGAVALALAAIGLRAERRQAAAPDATALRVDRLLGGDAGGFRRADAPRQFLFPEDHGPHDGFRTEWWYLTGNLEDGDGRRYGYQLTFFRQALSPEATPSRSNWRTSHLWMAHFALTDAGRNAFHAFERFGREALGLAGADRRPLRVWLEDWELAAVDEAATRFRLRAAAEGIELELELRPEDDPVLQGDNGLSVKGPEAGNASYYYSLPRLRSAGTLRLGAAPRRESAGTSRSVAVRGLSWLDREWSTSALGADLAGWDWFALQLDDGRDLMYYRLRRRDGTTAPESAGSLAAPDGGRLRLGAADVELTPLATWTSPRGGSYPSRWRLAVPAHGLDLEIEPLLADQELPLSVRYWEGAVVARGTEGGTSIAGRGYVELTGYAEALRAR